MKIRTILSFFVLILFALCLVIATPAQTRQPLLTSTKREGGVRVKDPTIRRSRNILVAVNQIRSKKNQKLIVPLFEGQRLTVMRERQEPMKNGLVWHGRVSNEPESSVTFTVVNEVLAGNITLKGGKFFQIRYIGKGVHSLWELNASKIPKVMETDLSIPTTAKMPREKTCETDSPNVIDVMVVYTTNACNQALQRGHAISEENRGCQMDNEIYMAVAEANTAYINSHINQRLNLVHIENICYEEGPIDGSNFDLSADLDNLAYRPTDPLCSKIRQLRDTYAADVVVLLIQDKEIDTTEKRKQYFGFTRYEEEVKENEQWAYSVVKWNFAAELGVWTFAHEVGHIMGAYHACGGTRRQNPSYAHGFADATNKIWTIMAQPDPCPEKDSNCDHSRKQRFSDGAAFGTSSGSCSANNALRLNETAITVANFRCGAKTAKNVWMKDTWNDTGDEPDPKTANEPMWKSPYIWVRKEPDPNRVHQHQHENPEYGQTNWVYVKLHNGGPHAARGELELYWARAATGLRWPDDWTRLASIPVRDFPTQSFPAHSTRIVEAEWPELPGTGHYCLLARWVSSPDPTNPQWADPMNSKWPEGPRISFNARNNNNIIYRNLNIVDLSSNDSAIADFNVFNPGNVQIKTDLALRPPNLDGTDWKSFIRHAELIIHFDEIMSKAWRKGGRKGTGFKVEGEKIILTNPAGASFRNITLPPKFSGRVRLTFKKRPTTPPRAFEIDVIQTVGSAGVSASVRPAVLDGISYRIHTNRIE